MNLLFFKKKNKPLSSLLHNKMKDLFIRWRLYYSRGLGYYDLIKQPAIALAALKIFNVPLFIMVLIVPLWFIFWFLLGWFDKIKVHLWQKEADWGAREVNPFNVEVLQRIKNIEQTVSERTPLIQSIQPPIYSLFQPKGHLNYV